MCRFYSGDRNHAIAYTLMSSTFEIGQDISIQIQWLSREGHVTEEAIHFHLLGCILQLTLAAILIYVP